MTKTIRISDEVDRYLKKHGKFGESHDDVLKKTLKNFGGFMKNKKILIQTMDVIDEQDKIQEWITFIDQTHMSSKSKEWRASNLSEFTLESNGEPINWEGENSFSTCNGDKLQVENYVPYNKK